MALTACPECGHNVSVEAVTCPNCGHPLKTQTAAAPARLLRSATPLIIALVAAGAIVIGSFLPWVSVTTIFGTLSLSGMQGDGVLTMIAGTLVAVVAGVALGRRAASGKTGILIVVLAAASGLISFNVFSNLIGSVSLFGESVLSAIGGGLWLVIVGSAVAIGAGFSVYSARDQVPEGSSQPKSAKTGVWVGVSVGVVFVIALMVIGSQAAETEVEQIFEEIAEELAP